MACYSRKKKQTKQHKAMELFGFTIIRTDELKQERAKNLQTIKELNEKVEKDYKELKKKGEELDAFISQQASVFFEQNEKKNDIELRKWCVAQRGRNGADMETEFMYRYIKNGDTSSIEKLKEFYDWRIQKREEKAKAEEAQKSAKESHQQ